MSDFSLSKYLTTFQTSDKRSFPAVENSSGELNIIIDQLAVSPEHIDVNPETFESLIDLCHSFPHLPPKLQTQLTYLVSSSMNNLLHDINSILNGSSNNVDILELFPQWKRHLEEYGYLLHVLLTFLHDDVHIASSQSSVGRGGNSSNKNASQNRNVELFKRSCNQIESIAEAVLKVLRLNLSRIFQTTPELDLFLSLFLRPLFVIIEVEPIVKVTHLKMFIQQVIARAVKFHGQATTVQSSMMSTLTYFLHLSTFNAEILNILNKEFDFSQLTEEILREISTRVFNAKDTTGPKAISNFLIKLSELSPQVMLRQMSLVIRLLNNSSITLRCSVVEACGNIVTELIKDQETLDHYKQQIGVLMELLEERFQDSNPFVRTKAIQGCLKICEMKVKFNRSRVNFTKLAVRSLEDRSSLVRRNAVKLLSKLLLTHPFGGMNGNQLILKDWEKCLEEATAQLDKYEESQGETESLDEVIERSLLDSNNDNERETLLGDIINSENNLTRIEKESEKESTTDVNKLLKIKLMVAYFEDAVDFIKDIHKAIFLSSNLLSSKNRNEVLDVMDFLVLTDAYSLEPSKEGIKKMLHLVWMKGTTDEGKSIPAHLISCYSQLFLTTPEDYNYKQKATHIAKNLIQLTADASLADLASLEQLLCLMYSEKLIDDNVVTVLWSIYNSATKESNSDEALSRIQVHGSIIVLGMLALTNHNIVIRGFDSLVNIGLGEIGSHDLILCKFSCLALERIVPKNNDNVSKALDDNHRDEAIKKLYLAIARFTEDIDYYPMCEQAISALFTISDKPDEISTELIKEKTMMTFGNSTDKESSFMEGISRTTSLSQLLFIVGQVAIRTLVYLERSEAEFKKRKIEVETQKGKEKMDEQADEAEVTDIGNSTMNESKDNEFAMIGGTNEDDFTDAIIFIKENELLYGENSILGKFCPIVEEIVSSNSRFNDPILQRTATLCLEKLMCVSSKYCEKSLPLLITVMEKSKDPIIRSNAVLGLGDMAVCFNNLVDENTDYLYRRLHDENLMVQRTCLMTVTFLILAGQVKVKGQLGEMAKCLENPDQGISDLCRLFFTELATKDNAIYNGFIDIFSNLSGDESLENESFKRITKFLLSFIEKERHQKQLSEKLLGRLSKCETQEQWDDIAFVLNCMPTKNEKISEILEQGFKIVTARE
ncbi:hypothetical protein Kpol_1042p13 [Vanderwaltozyma polyspora DSM 70294]|uniref:Condensin complex subunit 1 n=1 Tax=Vanderwaltozyma polyspora (strain ATCC 22028 / DSM 70294 / BCRC 21397 / CBS 2163 / NBRC 10782 / NRRL Y-8283 / UCD 57-17) TaxID=436907 RepID=A7TQA0_VANPO|nr:uncharacterized protein Kpol_1042p13 [Vanderwaltozyma polyspora DSM 70294]EDO15554.1 hypothetical protein Kpol_1042p13 [Vanderwaltozyma polyspora DSM 70294]